MQGLSFPQKNLELGEADMLFVRGEQSFDWFLSSEEHKIISDLDRKGANPGSTGETHLVEGCN